MITLYKKLREIYNSKHLHFLAVDYNLYKKWSILIKFVVSLNRKYVPCEIFRSKYKTHTNFVVIALRWNGKNVKRRTNGYAKEFIDNKEIDCIYCGVRLDRKNVTSDHILPISKGGNNCQVNIVVCCTDCNNERGNMSFDSYLRYKNDSYRDIKHLFI